MFHKHLSLLAFFLFSTAALGAKQLSATLDYALFRSGKGEQPRLEVYLSANPYTAHFQKADTLGHYHALLGVEVEIRDTATGHLQKQFRYTLGSGKVRDTSQGIGQLISQKNLLLPQGTYRLKVLIRDSIAGTEPIQTQALVRATWPERPPYFSSLQLIDSYTTAKKASPFTKGGYELTPLVSSFFPEEANRLIFYGEIYHTDQTFEAGQPFSLIYKIASTRSDRPFEHYQRASTKKAKGRIPFMTSIDIATLPSGNFHLVVEAYDAEGRRVAVQRKFFQRHNPTLQDSMVVQVDGQAHYLRNTFVENLKMDTLRYLLRSLKPIAKQEEKETINTLVKRDSLKRNLQGYLLAFWKRRNNRRPDKPFEQYQKKLKYAEKHYSVYGMEPWQTDRGEVFLKYGKPNQVDNQVTDPDRSIQSMTKVLPYEIWYYWHTDIQDQNNVKFVFVQENLGKQSYKLVHSTAIGEFRNPQWRNNLNNFFNNNIDQQNQDSPLDEF